ncbi:MAG: ROK family protein [Opitutaceae bacterium]
MSRSSFVFLGTDCGATTSKSGGVWADGSVISTQLLQSTTNAKAGTAAVVGGWLEGVRGFLKGNDLSWDQVQGAGLAIPGPYLRYGVLGRAANLPPEFEGWDFRGDFADALAGAAGRPVPLVVGNDGRCGGVAEAQFARGDRKASVLMVAPGSGLGCAYIDANGLPLEGDTLSGMEAAHMPLPLHLLGARALPCGCGRTWGCAEVYTTLSGLKYLLEDALARHPGHELATAGGEVRDRVLSLRGRAQKGDALAIEIFELQAKALGIHIASLVMALDPSFVVVGGGLMDPGATSAEFRDRYLRNVRDAASPHLWPAQRGRIKFVPAVLGELSQAIGAAIMARNLAKAAPAA